VVADSLPKIQVKLTRETRNPRDLHQKIRSQIQIQKSLKINKHKFEMNSFQIPHDPPLVPLVESTYVPTQISSEDIGSSSTDITSRVGKKFKLPKANYTKLQNFKKDIQINSALAQNSSKGFD